MKGLGVPGAARGAAGASLAAVGRLLTGTARPERPDSGVQARRWGLVIDLRRCDGCRRCTVACQERYALPPDQEWIRICEVTEDDGRTWFMPRLCMQCENAPCLKVCPVRATFRNREGVILIDQQRCIGCRVCIDACPYGARSFNASGSPRIVGGVQKPRPEFPVPQRPRTVGKCVLCVHGAAEGQLPACVDACDAQAIHFAELGADIMTNRTGETCTLSDFIKANGAFRFQEELLTAPRVWYVPAAHTAEGDPGQPP